MRLGHGTPTLVARSDSPTAQAVRTGFTRALAVLGLAGTEPLITTVSADRDPALFVSSRIDHCSTMERAEARCPRDGGTGPR